MSEAITNAGATGAAEQPAVPTESARIAAATALIGAPAGEPTPPEAAQKTEAKPPAPKAAPLADAIKEMRQKREQAAQEQQRRASYETDNERLRQELDLAKGSQHFEDDPVGYAQSRGWSKEQQLMFGQALLYDLAPDKADPNFRVKMFEDKQKRDSAAKEAAEREAREHHEQAAKHQEITQFAQALEAGVMSFEAGSYPESEAWFGDDVETYLQSLFATAQNIATTATQRGQVADLSPAAIAAALEAETARRMGVRDQRRTAHVPQGAPQQRAAQPAAGAEQSTLETTSTRNMSGSGTPLPPARTERERLERAKAVAFKSR